MNNWRKIAATILALSLTVAMTACGGDSGTSATDSGSAASSSAASSAASGESSEDEAESEAEEPAGDAEVVMGTDIGTTPREETLYFGGWQWGTPIDSNPYSSNSNNGMIIGQETTARLLVYEPLYMYNILDGVSYPLVADGEYTWNADSTILTVKINQDAKWSDGTALTAHDVVATFDAHVKTSSSMGSAYAQYISQMVAADDYTVEMHTNPDDYNPMKVLEYLPRVYVCQKAYIDAKFAEHGDDIEAFKTDKWLDAPYSGPYGPMFLSSQKVVLERNDDYWGQAASMWGKLPVPKYCVHNILASNDALRAAFSNGEIDINQQYITNVYDMWEKDGLPISTYLNDAPYYVPAQMPSIWFNTQKPGLDQLAVREAIAYATDYDQIAQSAMSGYTPTFEEEPRSIAAPLDGEKKFIDYGALSDLQWTGRDFERANKVLDDAGIVDTNGDGIREYDGKNLEFQLMCPKGWNDWEASLEIVAAAGKEIGLNLSTNFVEAAVWTESQQNGNFDIIMYGAPAASITTPWTRAFICMNVEDPNADRVFWGFHRMKDDGVNKLIADAATETDEAKLKEYYTEISKFLLEQKPLIYLMYRPGWFHTVNESVWTNFPEEGDGTNVPPQMNAAGYGIAGMYNLTNS